MAVSQRSRPPKARPQQSRSERVGRRSVVTGAQLAQGEGPTMKLSEFALRALRRRSNATAVGLFALGLLAVLMVTGVAGAAPSAVPLGASGSFSVLAGAGITNTGPTTVSGDIGAYPTTTITGESSMTVHGTNHAGDAVTQQAQNDLITAYNTAAGEGPKNTIAADLAGLTLKAGVYNSASTI